MSGLKQNLALGAIGLLAGGAFAQSYLAEHPPVAGASEVPAQSSQQAGQAAPEALAAQSRSAAPDASSDENPNTGAIASLEELVHQFIRNHEGLAQSLRAQDEAHYREFQLERDSLVLRIYASGSLPGGVEELERIADSAPDSAQDALDDLNSALDRLAEVR